MPVGNINYAEEYSRELSQMFPYVLYFGALYATENDGRYKWIDAKTIKIPSINTSGRVDADRDTIGFAKRNWSNDWELKTLDNERKWSTLVHPMDIDETNMVATIANITKTFNEEKKFPEMDAYTVSKIYTDWLNTVNPEDKTATKRTADTTALTTDNVLAVFDKLMKAMDDERVPANGRILYVTTDVKFMLKNAKDISRSISVNGSNDNAINRLVNRLDEVEIVPVPATLMKTAYNFTEGYAPAANAAQINMFLVNPVAVITPNKYEFAKLDEPSAMSEGKYVYYEESHEDVFILNKKSGAIQFNITASGD